MRAMTWSDKITTPDIWNMPITRGSTLEDGGITTTAALVLVFITLHN
jgi:hypothetical protein